MDTSRRNNTLDNTINTSGFPQDPLNAIRTFDNTSLSRGLDNTLGNYNTTNTFQPMQTHGTSTMSTTNNDINSFDPIPIETSALNDTTKTYDMSKDENISNPTLTSITDRLNHQTDSNKINLNDTSSLNNDQELPLQEPLLPQGKSKMTISLQNAYQSLCELFSLSDASISSRLFNEAKGIVFLTVIKGGIGIGGSLGSGILLYKQNNKWSNPCAIGLTGIQIGFDIGVERVDHILLLRDEASLQMFQSKPSLNIGSDISVAAGLVGGDVSIGVMIDDNMATTNVYSYSIAKGAYVGVSLNGSWIKIRDDWNEEFYGRKMTKREILSNYDSCNDSKYSSLINKLNEYCGLH